MGEMEGIGEVTPILLMIGPDELRGLVIKLFWGKGREGTTFWVRVGEELRIAGIIVWDGMERDGGANKAAEGKVVGKVCGLIVLETIGCGKWVGLGYVKIDVGALNERFWFWIWSSGEIGLLNAEGVDTIGEIVGTGSLAELRLVTVGILFIIGIFWIELEIGAIGAEILVKEGRWIAGVVLKLFWRLIGALRIFLGELIPLRLPTGLRIAELLPRFAVNEFEKELLINEVFAKFGVLIKELFMKFDVKLFDIGLDSGVFKVIPGFAMGFKTGVVLVLIIDPDNGNIDIDFYLFSGDSNGTELRTKGLLIVIGLDEVGLIVGVSWKLSPWSMLKLVLCCISPNEFLFRVIGALMKDLFCGNPKGDDDANGRFRGCWTGCWNWVDKDVGASWWIGWEFVNPPIPPAKPGPFANLLVKSLSDILSLTFSFIVSLMIDLENY